MEQQYPTLHHAKIFFQSLPQYHNCCFWIGGMSKEQSITFRDFWFTNLAVDFVSELYPLQGPALVAHCHPVSSGKFLLGQIFGTCHQFLHTKTCPAQQQVERDCSHPGLHVLLSKIAFHYHMQRLEQALERIKNFWNIN